MWAQIITTRYIFLKSFPILPLVLLCEAAVAMISCSDALVNSGGGGGVSSVRGGIAEVNSTVRILVLYGRHFEISGCL